MSDGQLKLVTTIPALNPSYKTISKDSRYLYAAQEISMEKSTKNVNESDDGPKPEFLRDVKAIVSANLDNESFDVPHLCRSNHSTGQDIRLIPLNQAKKLLETSDLNVSEVAVRIGFRHHANFSLAFENEFGISPKEV